MTSLFRLFPLVVALTCASGCYRSHWIAERSPDGEADRPPTCWVATAGPTYLTERNQAYAGTLIRAGDDILLGYGSRSRNVDPLPRTVAWLDDDGRPRSTEAVFAAPERQFGRRAVDLASTSLGVVATSFSLDRGCELRVLGDDPVVLSSEHCSNLSPNPTGGLLLHLGGIGREILERRFAHVTSRYPLRFAEGPRGVLGHSFSKVYVPLDRDRLIVAMAERDGGPIEAGILDWRTGERRLTRIHETGSDVRKLRLLPREDGWLLGWIERTSGEAFRLSLLTLDASGVPTGLVAHPDAGPMPDAAWEMAYRFGDIVIVYTDGTELRMATIGEDLTLGASVSTVAELDAIDQMHILVLDDGAVLVSFTEHAGTADRVGTLRAECR